MSRSVKFSASNLVKFDENSNRWSKNAEAKITNADAEMLEADLQDFFPDYVKLTSFFHDHPEPKNGLDESNLILSNIDSMTRYFPKTSP